MKDMKAEREQEAFRVGFADAQNGTSYAEGIGRFGRDYEQRAYSRGYLKGLTSRNSFKETGDA